MVPNTLEEAVALTQRFTSKPSNEHLLKLYGLYKQATEGDNLTEKPGGFDFKAAAKHHSWMNFKGKTKDDAAEAYIVFVSELAKTHI
jgi:acyl-CoA-binding protein